MSGSISTLRTKVDDDSQTMAIEVDKLIIQMNELPMIYTNGIF